MQQIFKKKSIDSLLEESNSSGGLHRSLSTANLVFLGIGAIVGTGIFVITGTAAANFAGPALTISFLISAICCIMAGLCYAEFAAMIPVAGSVYSYSYTTMGEIWAWFIGWVLILEYLFACSSVAVGWSGYFNSFSADLGISLPTAFSSAAFDYTSSGWIWTGNIINFPAVAIVVLLSSLLMGGIQQSSAINNLIVFIKVAVILLFIGFGLGHIDTSNWSPYIPENTGSFGSFGWSGILRGAGVVFYAYLGFDALSTAAQEVKNPQKSMPRGILISLLTCAILYIAVTAVLTGIVNYKELNDDAPIALAVDRVPSLEWLRPFIKLGAIAGLSSVILVMMMGQSRIYYAISKDGLLPSYFSRIHNKRRVPHIATIVACVVTSLFAGLFPLHILSELVSIGTLFAFTVVCVSIVVLRKTQPDIKRPFKVPFSPYLPILGAGICILQMVSLPFATWLRLIIWTIIGFIIYFTFGIRNSKLRNKQ